MYTLSSSPLKSGYSTLISRAFESEDIAYSSSSSANTKKIEPAAQWRMGRCAAGIFTWSCDRHVIGGSIGWVEELDDDLYLGSGENLRVLFVALGYHGGPHAAGVVHLATEEARGLRLHGQ